MYLYIILKILFSQVTMLTNPLKVDVKFSIFAATIEDTNHPTHSSVPTELFLISYILSVIGGSMSTVKGHFPFHLRLWLNPFLLLQLHLSISWNWKPSIVQSEQPMKNMNLRMFAKGEVSTNSEIRRWRRFNTKWRNVKGGIERFKIK